MKKIIFIVFIALISHITSALSSQDTIKIYFNANWEVIEKPAKAKMLLIVPPLNERDSLRNLYIYEAVKGKHPQSSHLLELNWKIKNTKDGYLKSKNLVVNEMKIIDANYLKNGQLETLDIFEDKKVRVGYLFYENGQIEDLIHHKYSDKLHTQFITSYHRNGVLKRTEQSENNKTIDGICYDSLGLKCEFSPYYEDAQFPGGSSALRKYLASVKYPMDAAKNKIQGRVFVSFYINKEGKEVDIKLERGKHPLLDRAAINQVANMPYWTPGKKKGKLSKIKYTVPINFTLQ